MEMPQFPQDFVKNHCPKVLEAKHWRQTYNVPGSSKEDDLQFAECAFRSAGVGMECENCNKFLTRPYTVHEVDRKYLPLIEDYYKRMEEYESKFNSGEKIQEEVMKILIRTPNESVLQTVLARLRSDKIRVQDWDKLDNYIVADIPQANADILLDLLALNVSVERDVKNDLD